LYSNSESNPKQNSKKKSNIPTYREEAGTEKLND